MACIVAAKIGEAGRASSAGLGTRSRQPKKDQTMFRKFAVALVAASVLTAPAFAQGNGATAAPRVKTETKSDNATPRVVNANPTFKTTKIRTSKRYARHHVKHVKHVAHAKRLRHVAHATPVKHVWHVAHVKPIKHVRHVAHVKRSGHVAHVKPVKHVNHVRVAHATHGTKAQKPVRHIVSKATTGQNGATALKAKSNVN
jgi:hypothetical protein